MKVLIFDLTNIDSLSQISHLLRSTPNIVHDIDAPLGELPVGLYNQIDQIWYTGTVLTKLADMFSANLFDDGCEFIFDTQSTILNTSVTILSNEQGITTTVTDFRTLL